MSIDKTLLNQAIDLSKIQTELTVADVFVFFMRNFMKASRLVMGISSVETVPGSSIVKVKWVCDAMHAAGNVMLPWPARTPFVTSEHALVCYDAARKWVSATEHRFVQLAASQQTTYCGVRFHLLPLEEMDNVFRTEATRRAEEAHAQGKVSPSEHGSGEPEFEAEPQGAGDSMGQEAVPATA